MDGISISDTTDIYGTNLAHSPLLAWVVLETQYFTDFHSFPRRTPQPESFADR